MRATTRLLAAMAVCLGLAGCPLDREEPIGEQCANGACDDAALRDAAVGEADMDPEPEPPADDDGDGVPDDADNCPNVINADQKDEDGDGVGDACDDAVNCGPNGGCPPGMACTAAGVCRPNAADTDGDGVPDGADNCPRTPNGDQADADGDGVGDACDDPVGPCEREGERCDTGQPGACAAGVLLCAGGGVMCQPVERPDLEECDGLDNDCDGVIDEDGCDPDGDRDGDGIPDDQDNCPDTVNPDQADADGDGVGDMCQNVACRPGGCAPGEVCDPTGRCVAEGMPCADDADCPAGALCMNGICGAAGEQCNGLDDDRDGVVDEGACDPALEECNMLDDDGDGRVDEGACQNAGCGGQGCPPGMICNPFLDRCVGGDPCGADADCPPGQICAAQGVCQDGEEACDGIDNDFDGLVDEGVCDPSPELCNMRDDDGDGVVDEGACPNVACGGRMCPDGMVCDPATNQCVPDGPQPEVCNGIDDDLDGLIDEEGACDPRPEECNMLDDDLDGVVDEDACDPNRDRDGDGIPDDQDNCPEAVNPDQADADGDGIGDACPRDVPQPEQCNMRDDDLDGAVDEGGVCQNAACGGQMCPDGMVCDAFLNQCVPAQNVPCQDDADCPAGALCTPVGLCVADGEARCDGIDDDNDGLVDEGACDPNVDRDGDGVPDAEDNCPVVFNPNQSNADGDAWGDACEVDADADGDGIPDDADNCPDIPNPAQVDADNDGIGDACDRGEPSPELCNMIDDDRDGRVDEGACDRDTDGDGIPDDQDNCPRVVNPEQRDFDGDAVGDACDQDLDSDGVPDDEDNCPRAVNPDQSDADGDGIGDACDQAPRDPAR